MYDLTNTALKYNLQHFFEVKCAPINTQRLPEVVSEIERIWDHDEVDMEIPLSILGNRVDILNTYLDAVASHIEGMYPLLYLPGESNVNEIKGVKKSERLSGDYAIGLGLVGEGLVGGARIAPYPRDVEIIVSSLGLLEYPHKLTTYYHGDDVNHEVVISQRNAKRGFMVKKIPRGSRNFFEDYFAVRHFHFGDLYGLVVFPNLETLSETTLKHQSLPKVREVSTLYRSLREKYNKK